MEKKDYFTQYERRFYAAHYNTSFSPEKRAAADVAAYNEELNEDLAELETLGSVGNYAEKYIEKALAYADRRSRCLSWMITGPANFPVARNEKANRSADNAWNEFREWRKRYIKRASAKPTLSPEEEIDEAAKELSEAQENHTKQKAFNKILFKKGVFNRRKSGSN